MRRRKVLHDDEGHARVIQVQRRGVLGAIPVLCFQSLGLVPYPLLQAHNGDLLQCWLSGLPDGLMSSVMMDSLMVPLIRRACVKAGAAALPRSE